ncbi:MAG: 3-phosphoshikimate 1-carboxyvinyltransferase [Firmicutes bacterium]|nr:3-phosphoshikimate 1-carboxyvinyltransferase [Bacillota bacterium]
MKNIRIISSKSDAHRALICAALSKEPCRVIYSGTSRDIEATEACLGALREGRKEMYCGESGSTLRFLLPLMGALGHQAEFHMEGRLPQRPLSPLYEELEAHGCTLSPQGQVPLTIEGQLQPGTYRLPGNVSSQYISGLLFALPLLDGDSEILLTSTLESTPYVDMTIKTLSHFGIRIEKTSGGYAVRGNQTYAAPKEYMVEGDWSNACFFLAAGAITEGGVTVSGLNPDSLQGDKAILDILQEMGATVSTGPAGITVQPGEGLCGITIDASQIPDMVPILSVLGLVASGTTEIRNAGRLRIKESDRLSAITMTLTALGGQVEELPDGLRIKGGRRLTGATIDSHNDHRIAMMAAIASLICDGKVTIGHAEAVEKSYPDFFDILREAGLDENIERK